MTPLLDEQPIRIALLALSLVFMPMGLYYRIASHTGEKIDRWQEGAVILFGLRLAAGVLFAGGLAWMIEPHWMAWSGLPLPAWLRWLGVIVAVGAALLFWWTARCLGKNLTDTVVTRIDHALVTSGPYRWVRHPFYVAFFAGVAGTSLAMANWFVMLAGGVTSAFLVARTGTEEQKLIERFGDDYRRFISNTGRFWPRWRNSSS
jgi:protein-S-isoprenylcysteine O-methyltransferase Ste14